MWKLTIGILGMIGSVVMLAIDQWIQQTVAILLFLNFGSMFIEGAIEIVKHKVKVENSPEYFNITLKQRQPDIPPAPPVVPEMFTCPECGKQFGDRGKLQRHYGMAHYEKLL